MSDVEEGVASDEGATPGGGKTEAPIAEVRAWANSNGYAVGKRGHLPAEVVDAFNRRHRVRQATNKNPWRQA